MAAPERVIYRAKPHWIFLAKPGLFVLLGLFCTLCTALTATAEPPPGQQSVPSEMIGAMAFCGTCIFLLALAGVVAQTFAYINSEFTLTNRRVILEVGGIRRQSLEIYLKQVDSLAVETSLLGGLLGYGTVIVMSGASKQPMPNVANPNEIRHKIQEQIARQ